MNINSDLVKKNYDSLANTALYKLNLKVRSWLYAWCYLNNIKQSLIKNIWNEKVSWNFLDIWCGTGAKTQYIIENLLQDCSKVFALDISDSMIEQAKLALQWYDVEFRQLDCMTRWEFSKLDLDNIRWVSINQVLHHYSIEEITVFLQNLFTILEPWAIVMILDWWILNTNRNEYRNWIRHSIYSLLIKTYETYKWSRNSIKELYLHELLIALTDSGFVIDNENSKNYFTPLKYVADYSPTYQVIAYKKS